MLPVPHPPQPPTLSGRARSTRGVGMRDAETTPSCIPRGQGGQVGRQVGGLAIVETCIAVRSVSVTAFARTPFVASKQTSGFQSSSLLYQSGRGLKVEAESAHELSLAGGTP